MNPFLAICICRASEGVQFFTQQKVTTSRWFSYGEGDIWHTEKK